ncbi:MAG: hypothetical protein QXW98_04955 [Candidatus Caldarchaeum sp.]
MDVICRFCGEPWDIYEFHDAMPPQELRDEFNDLKWKFFERAVEEIRKEGVSEKGFFKAVENRTSYYAMAALFRRHGCRAFGTSCGEPNEQPEIAALQGFSDDPEEWVR